MVTLLRNRSRIALLASLLCGLGGAAGGQAVHGVAVDERNVPVAGVVLLLMNDQVVAARALSNERGEYRLTASSGGTFRIRTLRIGFRPSLSGPVVLAHGQDVVKRLALNGLPFALDTVKVAGRNACHEVGDSAATLFALWEQVRTALTATQLSASTRAYTASTLAYERVLDRTTNRVRDQKATFGTSPVTTPWLTRSADSLHDAGYVITSSDSTTYFAPGLEVLLSDTFVEDHCFRIVPSPDPTRVGVEFAPSDDRRTVSDIRGVIWIDRASTELRSMEFRYANVAREQEERAGGEMSFVRLRNGAWAISRWNIRMPVLAQRRASTIARTYETFVVEVKVDGGELIVASQDNDTLFVRPPLIVRGVLVDSSSGLPVAAAHIGLVGTRLTGVTDESGHFTIENVLVGEYTAEVHTSGLDAIGFVSQSNIRVTDSAATIQLRVPSPAQVGAALCGTTPNRGKGIVIGHASFRGDATYAANLRVFASWNAFQSGVAQTERDKTVGASDTVSLERPMGRRTNQLRTTTDSLGRFRICGVPTNTSLEIQAEIDSASAEPVVVQVVGLFARAELLIDRFNSHEGAFTGRVLVDSTRRPIVDADVTLADLHLTQRSDSAGAFHFRAIPAGMHTITVRRVGYGALDAQITVSPSRTLDRQIFLSRLVSLDSVHVEADRVVLPDFEENRKIGLGHFLTRGDLAKQEGRRLSTILTGLGGIGIISGPQDAWAASGRSSGKHVPTREEQLRGAKVACYARVYLDNAVVYGGSTTDMLFNINSLSPAAIEAIEYYAGAAQTPLKYGGLESPCGVIVIWTRRTP